MAAEMPLIVTLDANGDGEIGYGDGYNDNNLQTFIWYGDGDGGGFGVGCALQDGANNTDGAAFKDDWEYREYDWA